MSRSADDWLVEAMVLPLEAAAKLDLVADDLQLPPDLVRDARLALAAAVERMETLVQLVRSGVTAFRQDFAGQCDEGGNFTVTIDPGGAGADPP